MDDIEITLNRRKGEFLDTVQRNIKRYIISRGKNCIGVVQRKSDRSVYQTWDFRDDLDDFAKVLFHFMRKKKYNGYDLDSALTDPITEMVEEEYQKFYESESEAMSNGMMKAIAWDEVHLKNFVDRISDIALASFSQKVRNLVVHQIMHQIQQQLSSGVMHNISSQISQVATTTAGAQVAAVVSHLLLKFLATHISTIVAKILASAVLKKAVALVANKVVFAAVGAAVLQFIFAHVGAAVGGSVLMWIAIPLIVAYIGYKVFNLPEKLGDEVSRSVRGELSIKFESMNRTILEQIFQPVFGGNDLANTIAKDPKFQRALREMGTSLESKLG